MVNVTTYDIYKLPVWIRYFYYTKQFRKLSEILTGQSNYILENTLYKKFKKFEVGGNTEQDGEPTPENPIPISNVVGTIVNKVSNKNLFDGEIELGSINPENGILVPNETRTRSKNFIKVKPNTTYDFSKQVGQYRWVIGYTINKEGITDGNVSGQASALASFTGLTQEFTTSPTTEYIKWYDSNSTDLTEKVQIEPRNNSNRLCRTCRANSRVYITRRSKIL